MNRAILFFAILSLVLSVGCSGDNPADSGVPAPTFADSPTNLITVFLPAAYSEMDSTAYAALLDWGYVFELLPDEPGPDSPRPWWDLDEEKRIAGNMFGKRLGGDGLAVERISLAMTVKSLVEGDTYYPDRVVGETWYVLTANVDLLVVVDYPTDPDGIINYVVHSNELFIVRPDPSRSGGWVVFKQVDQDPINKGGSHDSPGSATEKASWGRLKSLFR